MHKMMRQACGNGRRGLLAVLFFSVSSVCGHASALTWNLVNVSFSDGATATGSFVYDAGSNTFSNWNIDVTGSSHFPAGFDFTSGDSTAFSPTVSSVTWANFALSFAPELVLKATAPMSDAGGTIALEGTGAGTLDCWNGPCGVLQSGEITTTPEPATLGLCAGGAMVLAGIVARKRRAAR